MIKDKDYYLVIDYDIIITNLDEQNGGGNYRCEKCF